ncbi:MAG: recombinase family protein [Pseudomonadota bacterium]
MKTYYAYTRVSTLKQTEGASIDAQKEAIAAYAEKNDLKITEWFEESETAAKSKRPIFNKIIQALRMGKVDGLIVHKIDRSSRNFHDWAKIHDLVDKGVDIRFAHEDLDISTRGGRLVADIQAVVAADFIRNNREESIKGQEGRLREGLYPYKAPPGYLDNGKAKLKTICPERGPLVLKMGELYAAGNHSYFELAEEMNSLGLTTKNGGKIRVSTVEKILTNPFYIGIIKIRKTGKTYEGKHEPLFSPELFEAIKARREGRSYQRRTKHTFMFKGLFRCALCDNKMIGEIQKGHVYYRCHKRDCPTKCYKEERFDDQVRQLLHTHGLSEKAASALEERVTTFLKSANFEELIARADQELSMIKAREQKLTRKYLDDKISDRMHDEMKLALATDRKKWEQIRRENEKKGIDPAKLSAFLERAKSLHLSYISAAPAQKRIITEMTTSNRRVSGNEVEIEPQNWLSQLNFEDPSFIVHLIGSQIELLEKLNFEGRGNL